MIVELGTILESEFGAGPVVALTNKWIIIDTGDGDEAALPLDREAIHWCVQPTGVGQKGTKHTQVEIREEPTRDD